MRATNAARVGGTRESEPASWPAFGTASSDFAPPSSLQPGFGPAGWAFGNLFGLGEYGTYILQILFFALGLAIMIAFIRSGMHIEPFVTRE